MTGGNIAIPRGGFQERATELVNWFRNSEVAYVLPKVFENYQNYTPEKAEEEWKEVAGNKTKPDPSNSHFLGSLFKKAIGLLGVNLDGLSPAKEEIENLATEKFIGDYLEKRGKGTEAKSSYLAEDDRKRLEERITGLGEDPPNESVIGEIKKFLREERNQGLLLKKLMLAKNREKILTNLLLSASNFVTIGIPLISSLSGIFSRNREKRNHSLSGLVSSGVYSAVSSFAMPRLEKHFGLAGPIIGNLAMTMVLGPIIRPIEEIVCRTADFFMGGGNNLQEQEMLSQLQRMQEMQQMQQMQGNAGYPQFSPYPQLQEEHYATGSLQQQVTCSV